MVQPNTKCKNPNCTKGEDGKQKLYYTCHTCIKRNNWRIVACCEECYSEYLKIVRQNRMKKDENPTGRIDMTKEEIIDIQKNMSEEEANKKTLEDLKEYSDVIEEEGIIAAVEKANEDLSKYTCSTCGKTYKTVAGLAKHIASKHDQGDE